MAFPRPQYSRNQVNRAGEILCRAQIELPDADWAFDVLSNWRSCHGYPINTFQATLRTKLEGIDPDAIVAQRLKRIPSILSKLRRFDSMQLARMQDIGGLRAVVNTLGHVREVRSNYRKSRFLHDLVAERDYIDSPKHSGYRGIHLVYRYKSDIAAQYNGLLLELQLRTKLQHTWATAVETMGTFLNHALKSSEGPEEWLDFFSLTGSAFALKEKTTPVPRYAEMSAKETYAACNAEAERLNVRSRLEAFSVAANSISQHKGGGTYHLIVLDPINMTVQINSYSRDRLEEANKAYTKTEERIVKGESIQAVLVSAGPIDQLRRAYPNYFLDTREFLHQLDRLAKTK